MTTYQLSGEQLRALLETHELYTNRNQDGDVSSYRCRCGEYCVFVEYGPPHDDPRAAWIDHVLATLTPAPEPAGDLRRQVEEAARTIRAYYRGVGKEPDPVGVDYLIADSASEYRAELEAAVRRLLGEGASPNAAAQETA